MTQNEAKKAARAPGADAYFTLKAGGPRVRLEDHARETGRHELPATTTTEPNDFETAIIRQHEQDHSALLERTRSGLKQLEAEFNGLEKQLPRTGEAEIEVRRATEAVEHDLHSYRPLARLRAEERTRLRDLRVFVRRHRLGREAHYPDSSRLTIALLLGVILIESLLNMAFFGQASEYGMLGGFFIAGSVSAFNVITSFFVGRGLRYFNHIDRWRRGVAGVGMAAYALLMIVFNLAVGHYRDMLSATASPLRDSLQSLAHGPLDLSFNSYLLFCVGMLAAILATWKGYVADDPYPGYGNVHRRHRDAQVEFDAARERGLHAVLAHVRGIPAACDERMRVADQTIEALEATHVKASRLAHEYDAGRAQLRDRCEVLLSEYREENRMIRTTPPPAYFSQFPDLADALDRSCLLSMTDRIRFARQAIEQLKVEVGDVKRQNTERVAETAARFDAHVEEHARRAEDEVRQASPPEVDSDPAAIDRRAS